MSENKQLLPGKTDLEKALLSMQSSKGEQSVRTTFRFSEEFMDSLAQCKQHGLTLKELLDRACSFIASKQEDDGTLYWDADDERDYGRGFFRNMKEIAADTSGSAVRKTFVISKTSLSKLNTLSEQYETQRDILAEAVITKYLDWLLKDQEATTEKYRKALDRIGEFKVQADSLLEELQSLLGDDDPIRVRFGIITDHIIFSLIYAINENIESGTPIDPDSLLQKH